MPVHDWTRVEAGIFHSFHLAWVSEINKALNDGLLPDGYYALAEQHFGYAIADVLTLRGRTEAEPRPIRSDTGGTALAEAPPSVRCRQTVEPAARARRRTLTIRHVSGHYLVAVIEVVSPANKDRVRSLDEFVAKAVDAIDHGVHLLLVDLFPPGRNDPNGMHDLIRRTLEESDERYELPCDEPLTLASYAAGWPVEIYLEHVRVGARLPQMPLFLQPDRYINVPLEPTYLSAYRGMPAFWRDVLEGRPLQNSES